MPDHVHWLFSLDDGALDRVIQRFKSRAARTVNAAFGTRGAIWQAGYHDHAVRREEDIRDLARDEPGQAPRSAVSLYTAGLDCVAYAISRLPLKG